MKHLFLSILIALSAVFASDAATVQIAAKPRPTDKAPDMEQIRRKSTDPSSRFYFPTLLKKFLSNDTTLNLEQYRYLYLGAMFQEDYDPYRSNPLDADLEHLYSAKQNHSRADLDSIVTLYERVRDDDPFDLSQINYYIFALRRQGKTHKANIWQHKLNHLLEAILSTGTGADPEHAWIVIDPSHEFHIVNFQNATVEKAEFTPPFYDKITLRPAPTAKEAHPDNRDCYFNIRYLLEEYYRKHPEESVR